MSNVVRFVPKSERERERLIREARAIYDSIFPPVTALGEPADDDAGPRAPHEAVAEIKPKQR
ncbi:hypothetical protein [Bradyrhizobium sp. 930_D9_N1_4]|uniref:hypothetical protein n=1 Tax=Bradyrhizobium sp. 930_D9_N1_4 TaxID=3240374 RepID=UPI003F891D12